jgi:hypothetical protein
MIIARLHAKLLPLGPMGSTVWMRQEYWRERRSRGRINAG